MKSLYLILVSLFIILSCKGNLAQSQADSQVVTPEQTQGEQLALEAKRKQQIQNSLPECIKEKIQTLKNGQVRNPPTVAQELKLDGKRYYLIPSGCCDQYDYIIDENCKTFCSQGYGITGKFKNGCDTLKNATRKVIWRDKRTL